jgi:hypothetical protein
VFAGAAIEALLLWALQQDEQAADRVVSTERSSAKSAKSLNDSYLPEFIERALAQKLIGEATASQARLAKDARNLIHPGRSARLGASCNKGTALAGLAGLEQVVADLARHFSR